MPKRRGATAKARRREAATRRQARRANRTRYDQINELNRREPFGAEKERHRLWNW